MRENNGELALAKAGKLPKLIGYGDLLGDLQTQTNWTDGEDSIEKMAEEAEKFGLEYIVITDHTKSLAMTGGALIKLILN
ncbi:MAG: polymerase X family protein [Candidatus Giovannonibacteria bacterium GW2011_GWC2_43_8]|nr:MAG: polymerase X family protein [Candidatus Giovannonibacteria bacterium GW2011_GWC2_43_8]